jgi:pyruvate dehydrogenase E1 component beta subunit
MPPVFMHSSTITTRWVLRIDAPIVRLSSQDIPTPYNGGLENLTIVQPETIAETIKKLMANQI